MIRNGYVTFDYEKLKCLKDWKKKNNSFIFMEYWKLFFECDKLIGK